MKVFRLSKQQYIQDLSGTGAATYPGRWNSKGVYILYTAATSSLALLESVVHISGIIQAAYMLATIDIPDAEYPVLKEANLPSDWHLFPSPDILKSFGDEFIKENKSLAMKVPSVIMPEEYNYLLNPGHADFRKVKVVSTRPILIDERLRK